LVSIAPKFFQISDPSISNLDAIAYAGESNIGLSGLLGSECPGL